MGGRRARGAVSAAETHASACGAAGRGNAASTRVAPWHTRRRSSSSAVRAGERAIRLCVNGCDEDAGEGDGKGRRQGGSGGCG